MGAKGMTPAEAARHAEFDIANVIGCAIRLWLLTTPSPVGAMSVAAYLRAAAMTLDQRAEQVIRQRAGMST